MHHTSIALPVSSADEVGLAPERLARIDEMLQAHVDRETLSCAVALVARCGRIVYARAFGRRTLDPASPAELDTIFRIYSMSKPMIAAAALILLEEGRLLLDDPIADYIPAFGATRVYARERDGRVQTVPQRAPLTLRHLLTHTSGILYPSATTLVGRIYVDAGLVDRGQTLSEFADTLARQPLAFQPGCGWAYGLNIDVLGHVIEVIAGQTLDRFLQERLFDPLDMSDTGFWVPEGALDRPADACSPGEDGLRLAGGALDVTRRPVWLSGGGGLVSTAHDYWRFAQMLANGGELDGVRVLSPKTVQLMAGNQLPESWLPFVPKTWPFRRGYGMGLGVRTVVDAAQTGMPGSLGAFTWQGAASTDFWVDPAERLVGVLMAQVLPGTYRAAQQFRTMVYSALVG